MRVGRGGALLLVILLGTLLIVRLDGWLDSAAGAQALVQAASRALPGRLQVETIDGNAKQMTLHQLSYHDEGVEVVIQKLHLKWQPWRLLSASLIIDTLSIDQTQLTLTPSGGDSGGSLSDLQLPLRLVVKEAHIRDLTLLQTPTSGASPLVIQQLSVAASSWWGGVDLTTLNLTTPEGSLELSGTLKTTGNYPLSLTTHWRYSDPNRGPIKGAGRLEGDLSELRFRQQIEAPTQVELSGALLTPRTDLRWRLKGKIPTLTPTLIPQGEGMFDSLSLTVEAEGDLQYALGSGRLLVNGGQADGVTAEWQGEIDLHDLQLQLEQLVASRRGNTARLQASGDLGFKNNTLIYALHGTLTNLMFSPQMGTEGETTEVMIEQSDFTLSGRDQSYQIAASATLSGDRLPSSNWKLHANGDAEQFRLKRLDGRLLNGTVRLQGELSLRDTLSWSGLFIARDINPAPLLQQWGAEWEGALDADLSFNGHYGDSLTLTLPSLRLNGKLHGQPLALEGAGSLEGERVHLNRLTLQAGEARLTARGEIDEQLEGELTLDAPDLSAFWPGVTGALQAALKSSGARQAPRIEAHINGHTLQWQGYTANHLKSDLDIDLAGISPWSITADGDGINSTLLPNSDLAGPFTLALRTDGSAADHRLTLSLHDQRRTLTTALQGHWQQQQWSGTITAINLIDPLLGHWSQRNPTELTLSAATIMLQPLCLQSEGAEACINYQHPQGQAQQVGFTLSQYGLARLAPITAPYARLEATLDAQINLSLADNTTPSVSTAFNLSGGRIIATASTPTQVNAPIQFEGGHLKLTLQDGVLDTETALILSAQDRISARATSHLNEQWLSHPESQIIEAQLQATLQQLSLLELVSEQLERPIGRFYANLQLNGPLAAPRLSGEAELMMKSCQIPRLGLTLSDIKLVAHSDNNGRLTLTAAARSGKGTLSGDGWLEAQEESGWHSALNIKGDQFEISHIPEAQIAVSPQLQLQAQPGQLSLNGELRLDESLIVPHDISLAKGSSADVIVVRPAGEVIVPPRWQVNSDIRLLAANTIRLKGMGFDGRLGGNLRLIDEPGKPPRARGELHLVAGARYRAFGQNLEAEHGRLLYADSPLDNPTLDIRAIRRIGDIVAGVHVEGSARQPRLTLFSRPVMDQAEILAYLTLGRPLARASAGDGQTMVQAANTAGLAGGDYLVGLVGSRFGLDEARIESNNDSGAPWLVLGRYLSPRLYIRYGVGLVESGSSLVMRYQLNERWTLQGEGGSASGGDIIYTIERP